MSFRNTLPAVAAWPRESSQSVAMRLPSYPRFFEPLQRPLEEVHRRALLDDPLERDAALGVEKVEVGLLFRRPPALHEIPVEPGVEPDRRDAVRRQEDPEGPLGRREEEPGEVDDVASDRRGGSRRSRLPAASPGAPSTAPGATRAAAGRMSPASGRRLRSGRARADFEPVAERAAPVEASEPTAAAPEAVRKRRRFQVIAKPPCVECRADRISRSASGQSLTRHHSSDHGSRDICSAGFPPGCTQKPSEKLTPNPFSGSKSPGSTEKIIPGSSIV